MARFGRLKLRTRPIKIAFLVEPNNARHVREAIKICSSLWGGAYCPILPLHKRMPKTWRDGPLIAPKAKDVILGYIEAFDPDVLVQFGNDIPQYIKDLKLQIVKPKEIWRSIKDENYKSLSPEYGIGFFEILNDIYKEHFKYNAKYPVKVVLPKLPKSHSLFWASVFGELSPDLISTVKENYSEPLEITEPDFQPGKYGDFFKADILFPRRIAQYALEHIRHSGMRRSAYAFFMDATKVEDIVDYWNLRAMGRQVLPIPKQYIDNKNIKEEAISFFKAHRVHWRHNKSICHYASIIRSRNSTMKELEAYTDTLNMKPEKDDPSKDGFFSLQHWYPRVWDEWARDKDGAIPDDFYGDDESIEINSSDNLHASFQPLLPKFAIKYVFHGKPRCANEISFRLYGSQEYLAEAFPKFTGENFLSSISNLGAFRDSWRVGRNGLVKLIRDNHQESWEIPQAQKVFFAWLKDLGWDAELSPPGMLAKQIYKQLDGNPFTLANPKLLGLLEHMNGGMVKSNGDPIDENKVNQPRELPIGELRTRLKNSRGYELSDYLISKGVFHVGLRIKCPSCMRNTWFPINLIEKRFTCPLCLNPFPAIGNVENGTWCYKTTGPFSVPHYADGAFATLLTVGFFNNHRLTNFQSTSTLSFTAKSSSGKIIEADFALFWQDALYMDRNDGVVFGECKTYGKFQKKDFERMSFLAKNFPGAILVFSTLRKTLTEKEVKEISRIARIGRKYWKNDRPINPVLILTRTELFDFIGPPYCWEDIGFKDKFDRLNGLISICDASQQIYLGLPSWETEWHEKLENKHKKKASKNRIVEQKKP